MIRMHAQFRVRAGEEVLARSLIGDFLIAIRERESGTRLYESFVDHGGRDFVHVMEFKDPAALQAHKDAPHTRAFTQALYPLCEAEPTFVRLELFDSNRR